MTDRDETIETIRKALKDRSGKTWSVRGGRKGATDWGWITITAPPARLDEYDCMTAEDIAELSQLLNESVPGQGAVVAASTNHRQEYIDRAEGRAPSVHGTSYWD